MILYVVLNFLSIISVKRYVTYVYLCLMIYDIRLLLVSVKMYLNHQIVTQIYPLHDQETIKRLGHDWYSPYQVLNYQPIGMPHIFL